MRPPKTRLISLATLLALCCCAGAVQAQQGRNPVAGMDEVHATHGLPVPHIESDDPLVARGEYLVRLLGCASCHTGGALVGKPDPALALAGSRIGIAYTSPLERPHPGVVYPRNLTGDSSTGLGEWSEEDIVRILREGRGRHGGRSPLVMPWVNYTQLQGDDALAIARYLKALPPIHHRVPERVPPGTPANTPLVHVGLYLSEKPGKMLDP